MVTKTEKVKLLVANGEFQRALSIARTFKRWGSKADKAALVPLNLRGKVLTLEEVAQYMDGWSFNGDYGAVTCYAVHVWTKTRVIFVTCYDGATWLSSVPRNPCGEIPVCHGGQ